MYLQIYVIIVLYNQRKYWQNCRKAVTQSYRALSEKMAASCSN